MVAANKHITPIEILFEDENFLIVNKPSGLVVHSTLDKKRDNLYDLLKTQYEGHYLGLQHRLDRDTSGAILFTKNENINKFVQEGFQTHRFIKKYWAIVEGIWQISSGEDMIQDFLKKEKNKSGIEWMVKVNKGGVKAISKVRTLKFSVEKNISLIEFALVTGRMHQLRAQSSFRNHPIVGDVLYGRGDNQSMRLMLHSNSLEFDFDGKKINVCAPRDSSFSALLDEMI